MGYRPHHQGWWGFGTFKEEARGPVGRGRKFAAAEQWWEMCEVLRERSHLAGVALLGWESARQHGVGGVAQRRAEKSTPKKCTKILTCRELHLTARSLPGHYQKKALFFLACFVPALATMVHIGEASVLSIRVVDVRF
eukprot:TRINITY_DN34423_c0_g1_i1.p2 TRINITY_DN34423_c0_g1~~TRINITY_DN34423_c0_g1_i1.p2  ORF type:complete len:138 (-),score=0.13 TRINITY_DN34423_c0_g1_i1:89-502(-)